ncbi:MAG: HAD family hydrolase [Pseudomonadota bacterium]
MQFSQLVIFDWDGTLMDSIDRIVSAMQVTAQSVRLSVPEEQAVKDIIGLSLEPALERLFGQLPTATLSQFLARYRDEYVDLNATPTPLFADAIATLHTLHDTGHGVAVATGKARRGLDRVWQETNVGHLFHASRCADETCGKPDPEMLHQLMDEFQVSADNTIMVGDSIHDMQMAKAAGVHAVGVDFGAHDGVKLKAAGADHVISQLQQLPELIRGSVWHS